jgi:dipeptidyl aminopeptidase/acylaminoacyl peptidase
MRALHLLLSSVLFAFAVSLAPFTATDLHKLIRVGNPVVSSTDVVFTIREWNATTGAHRTSLQIMCVACTNNKISEALTPAVWGVTHSNPVFSPDGNTVFYFSNENQTAGTQVYTVDVATKKSTQLTYLPDIGYSNLMFSPNGKYILFSAEVYQSCSTLQCTKDLNDQV